MIITVNRHIYEQITAIVVEYMGVLNNRTLQH